MTEWKLNLREDILRYRRPAFPTLEDRIQAYENFYLSAGPYGKSCVRDDAPQDAPSDASLEIRRTHAPFSTLLCLYDSSGEEYTFSSRGMRRVRRILPWQGHYHTHDYIEILHVLKGTFHQILLGEPRSFSAGEFVITDKNLEHADVREEASDAVVLFLSLQSDYLDRLLASFDRRDELQRFLFQALFRQRREQNYIHLQPSRPVPALSEQLSATLETLIREDYFPLEGSDQIIQGSLIRLLSLLCRHYSMKRYRSDRESRERALLYELERHIRLRFGAVDAGDLEKVFHYHRNYYNLLLQKYRGVSFQQYVRQIRMEHAAGLLRNTRLPVREIALSAGYHNNSHFYHLFEQHFGMSPSEYRNRRHPDENPNQTSDNFPGPGT